MLSITASVFKKLGFSACCALVWCGVSGASNWPATGVLPADLELRRNPATQSPITASLKKGCQATVLSREGQWLKVVYDGQTSFTLDSEPPMRLLAENAQNIERKRKAIDQDLENMNRKVRDYSEAEKSLAADLNQTARRRNNLSLQIAKYQTELAVIEKKISRIQEEFEALAQKILVLEKDVSQRVIALYKLYRLGQLNVLGSAQSIHEFIQRKTAFHYILADDQRLMQALSNSQNQMEFLIRDLALQKDEKARIQRELKIQAETLKTETAQREQMLVKIQNNKMLALSAIDALKKAAEELDRKIQDFADEPSAALEKHTPYEDFTKLKGLLNMPVKGIIAGAFGHHLNPRFNVENFRSGIEIKAEKGEPVRAVCKGRVVYAQWFQNYGNMIIVDHGRGYHTVYAYAEELFKAKGDPVETGEVIATVGDTGPMAECALYFEIRSNGKPVNPAEWIKKS